MGRDALDYRPAQNDDAATQVVPQVERFADGRVVVRAAYAPGTYRDAIIGAAVACAALASFPIAFVLFMGLSFASREAVALLPWMVFTAVVAWFLVGRVRRVGQSYMLEIDREGVTILRFRGRREWREHVPRERICDVRIGFAQFKSGRSTAWLIISVRPWYRKNLTLLHDLGGDRLVRVADAVREGLGLEPAEWPSGRPRRAAGSGGGEGGRGSA